MLTFTETATGSEVRDQLQQHLRLDGRDLASSEGAVRMGAEAGAGHHEDLLLGRAWTAGRINPGRPRPNPLKSNVLVPLL